MGRDRQRQRLRATEVGGQQIHKRVAPESWLRDRPAALNDADQDDDDGQHQQDVDESTQSVRGHEAHAPAATGSKGRYQVS